MQMQQPMTQPQRLLQQMNAEPQTPSTGLVLGDQSDLCNVLWNTQLPQMPPPQTTTPQPGLQQAVASALSQLQEPPQVQPLEEDDQD